MYIDDRLEQEDITFIIKYMPNVFMITPLEFHWNSTFECPFDVVCAVQAEWAAAAAANTSWRRG